DAVGDLVIALRAQPQPERQVERQRHGDPRHAPQAGFAEPDTMRAAPVHHEQVDGERDDQQDREGGPQQRCTNGFHEFVVRNEKTPGPSNGARRFIAHGPSPTTAKVLLMDAKSTRGSGLSPVMTIQRRRATPLRGRSMPKADRIAKAAAGAKTVVCRAWRPTAGGPAS